MSNNRPRRESAQASSEKTGTDTSKDDENLMHNWSLTFTEYAEKNSYNIHGKDVTLSTSDGVSESKTANGSAVKAPDGRGKETEVTQKGSRGGKGQDGNIIRTIASKEKNARAQMDDHNEDQSYTIPDDTATDTFTLKDSEENDKESRQSPFKADENTQTEGAKKRNANELSKYQVLPDIAQNQKAQTTDNVKSRVIPEMSMALSVGAKSGNKAPRNTPATGGGGGVGPPSFGQGVGVLGPPSFGQGGGGKVQQCSRISIGPSFAGMICILIRVKSLLIVTIENTLATRGQCWGLLSMQGCRKRIDIGVFDTYLNAPSGNKKPDRIFITIATRPTID
ncbi:hypothetical protein MAR_008235 [Mya arenaria]|uniref:Uncharacterized protein n=1 Tax=Mya arenaria TaxID=6604 RepID=A0ABY7DYJ9_MYAAR|nr:hypothetical protein MAR_008235 [Mya arenaria]